MFLSITNWCINHLDLCGTIEEIAERCQFDAGNTCVGGNGVTSGSENYTCICLNDGYKPTDGNLTCEISKCYFGSKIILLSAGANLVVLVKKIKI